MLCEGVDHLIDASLPLLGNIAAALVVLVTSTGSTIHNSGWTLEDGCMLWKQTSRSLLMYNRVTAPRCVFHTFTASGEEKLPSTVTVLMKFYLSPGISSVRMLGSGEIRVKIYWWVVHLHHGNALCSATDFMWSFFKLNKILFFRINS